jgi:hypothetical protein
MKTFTFAISRSLTEDENQSVFDWLVEHGQFVKIFPTFWMFQSPLPTEQLHAHFLQLLPPDVKAVVCNAGEYPEFVGIEPRDVLWLWRRP